MARRAAINEVRPVLEEIDKVVDVVDTGLDAVEKSADVATEAVDKGVHIAVEEVRKGVGILRNPKTAVVVLIGVTAAAGTIVGFQIAKRRLTKKYEAELEAEVEKARKFFGRLNKMDDDGAVLTPEDIVEKNGLAVEASEALQEYKQGPRQYDKVEPKVVVDQADGTLRTSTVVESSNVFLDGRAVVPEDFDLDAEKKTRSIEAPYIITKEEFFESEQSQASITYFAGDDVLADEKDQPIEDVEATVGIDNLARFGHGSGDPKIVYVRNERTEMDFEIAYSDGKYAEEVLGFIEHSDRPVGTRKFRPERGE